MRQENGVSELVRRLRLGASISRDAEVAERAVVILESLQRELAEVNRKLAECLAIAQEHVQNTTPPSKAHGDTYLDGWRDAANIIAWAIADEIEMKEKP